MFAPLSHHCFHPRVGNNQLQYELSPNVSIVSLCILKIHLLNPNMIIIFSNLKLLYIVPLSLGKSPFILLLLLLVLILLLQTLPAYKHALLFTYFYKLILYHSHPCFIPTLQPHWPSNSLLYSHAPRNKFLVNDGPQKLEWSHKIIIKLKNAYHLVIS